MCRKNYNANDFITGFGGDSGIPYIHRGTSQILSSLRVRIIDPQTDLSVVGLGPNSTILLEIVKADLEPKKK